MLVQSKSLIPSKAKLHFDEGREGY